MAEPSQLVRDGTLTLDAALLPATCRAHSFSLDIGGTMAKAAIQHEPGRIELVRCPTEELEPLLAWLLGGAGAEQAIALVGMTGGGAKRCKAGILTSVSNAGGDTAGVREVEEMQSIVQGLQFVNGHAGLLRVVDKADPSATVEFTPYGGQPEGHPAVPAIAVSIGSGTSVILMAADGSHSRVSGTCYGGATYWALQRLATGCTTFDELDALLARGNSANVDMLVGDIYGDTTEELGLPADLLAASLAKFEPGADPADVARSVRFLTTFTIAQLAVNCATTHGANEVFFVGGFVNDSSAGDLALSVKWAGAGKHKTVLLSEEVSPFIGALGVLGAGPACLVSAI